MTSSLSKAVPALLAVVLCLSETPAAQNTRALVERAKQAVQSGPVNLERDLAPLIEALRKARADEDREPLVDAIEDLGRGDGSSPAAVKKYLLEQAEPLFLEIARSAKSVFLRGGVLLSLRNMGASRATLEKAAEIAEADPDSYVQSRGEILRNFIASMPAQSVESDIRPSDPEREGQALEILKQRGLGASAEQLRLSSLEGDYAAVQALLDAGVDPNSAASAADAPLTAVVFSGCGANGGETADLIRTVNLLLAAGADPSRQDDNGNTALFSAAQMCGPVIVAALIDAGCEVNLKNGSGISPLAMALILQKFDSADILVERGARLDAQQTEMLTNSVSDPRGQKIIQRAKAK